jgi:hypothetical protein
MAKVKFSELISDISGSINHNVYTRNKYSNIVKSDSSKPFIPTYFQTSVQNKLGNLAPQWKTLTEENRNNWKKLASSIFYTDSFGKTYNPTPFNLFTQVNSNLLNIGKEFLSEPVSNAFPPALLFSNFTQLEDPEIDIVVYFELDELPPDAWVQYYISSCISPGRYYSKGNFMYCGFLPSFNTSPIYLGYDWISRVQSTFYPCRLFLKIRTIHPDSGLVSSFQYLDTLVERPLI